jgi:hypothetical protein
MDIADDKKVVGVFVPFFVRPSTGGYTYQDFRDSKK